MKPTTVLTSKGAIASRDRIGPRLHGLLIDAMMRLGRERRALSGLEIHEICAFGRAVQAADRRMRFVEQGEITPKARLAASEPAID